MSDPDMGGVALQLRDARAALGAATLRFRADDYVTGLRLVARALRCIVLAEADIEAQRGKHDV